MKTSRNFNSLFDSLYGMMENEAWMSRTSGSYLPAINIIEDESQYELELAVPGMNKEAFSLQLDSDNQLIIKMDKSDKETTQKRYLRQQFSPSAFCQKIVLPEDVNREGVSAHIENGILYITLPKLQPEVIKPEIRHIAIS